MSRFPDYSDWLGYLNIGSNTGQYFRQGAAIWGLYFEGGLFAFDYKNWFSFLDSVAFLLQPFNYLA